MPTEPTMDELMLDQVLHARYERDEAVRRAVKAEEEVERLGTALHRAMWALHQSDPETAMALELEMLEEQPS